MAKKFIGGLPVRGVIALCALLLLAPEARSQTFGVTKKTYTISGSIGEPGVTMQGLPGAPMTDQNGVYSVDVESGWSGKVRPIKPGYTFTPAERDYPPVREHKTQESYTATLQTFRISGSVMMGGVTLTGFPTEVVSDPSGRYSTTVPYGWVGTVVPDKPGYRFEPPNRPYSQVTKESTTDDYKPVELTFTISGAAGVEGVVMQGLPGNPVTGQGGSYRVDVKWNWSGKVTPTKEGHHFTPETREYRNVTANQTNDDYTVRIDTYQISGTTGMAGVQMKGLPGEPVTDMNGYYTVTVTHGWSGNVTPDKPGFRFTPPSRAYPKVVSSYEGQDYEGSIVYLKISGNAGSPGVTLSGLPGDPVSDAGGFYTAEVQYGWSNTVTPQKEGFSFEPASRPYSAVAADMANQNYTAKPITYRISGNAGMAGVVMQGLPGSPVSAQDGSYTADVSYNWNGTVTPRRDGYTFEPASREYQNVLSAQPFQDYTAKVKQYSLTGQIVDETGSPVPDAAVVSDTGVNWTKTDMDGRFDLKVDHGWKGRITPTKDGFTFNPTTRPFESPVAQDFGNLNFAARVKMLTITNQVRAGTEPIQGVTITTDPGGRTATTGADGKYSIQVPYGWTGKLVFTHPEFNFDPNFFSYTNVTENIDATAPAKPPTTTQPGPGPSPQPGPGPSPQPGPGPSPQPGPGPSPQPGPGPSPQPGLTLKQSLLQQLNQIRQQLAEMGKLPAPLSDQQKAEMDNLLQEHSRVQGMLKAMDPQAEEDLVTKQPDGRVIAPPVVDEMQGPYLLDVLMDMSRDTGVRIAVDATVKNDPVGVGYASVMNLPPQQALRRILESAATEYRYEMMDERTYKVYRPLSNQYAGNDLRLALQDLSTMTGVPILPDPNVTGEVNANFQDVPLETALEIMLAGTPFVYRRTPHYYLVADRNSGGPAFIDISETRRIRLSHMSASRALSMLHPSFRQYVTAEPMDPLDPNDAGRILIVTAPMSVADRIMADINRIDYRRRHVLLDARVVVMERGDLLNLGVEWGFPSIRYGEFKDATLKNSVGVGGAVMRGLQIGYSPDRTFTDSLLLALNLLAENSQADIISSPQVLAQDGKQSEIRVVTEEWFWMSQTSGTAFYGSYGQLEKIESGTVLTITPHVGDNNDITLEMAVEVSDSVPAGRGSDLPVVTRRLAKNYATVEDGGTIALAGLTENRAKLKDKKVPGLGDLPLFGSLFRNRENDKATREVAVFVTAHLIPEGSRRMAYQPAYQPQEVRVDMTPAGPEFREGLRQSLAGRGGTRR